MVRKLGQVAGFLVVAVLALLAVYYLVVRPWHRRMGATRDEVRRSLPGDDLVSSPSFDYTQAITIDAAAAEVWPWLVQIGYKRAGWYSWDAIHRIIGSAGSVDDERRSADRVIPELQNLTIGDEIWMASPESPLPALKVVSLEPSRALVLSQGGDVTSWTWFLDPIDAGKTRLIVRYRQHWEPSLANSLMYGVANDLGSLLMQPKTLRGIRARAEGAAGQ